MKHWYFLDAYRPIGRRFYAECYTIDHSGTGTWTISGIDKHWHYIVAHGLSWFFAKLYVDRLNRIARICARDDVPGKGHIRHFADLAAIARGEVEI